MGELPTFEDSAVVSSCRGSEDLFAQDGGERKRPLAGIRARLLPSLWFQRRRISCSVLTNGDFYSVKMNTFADTESLLREYVDRGSETAFEELVCRHVNLVYSAAFRRCGGDAALAAESTQAVFTDLARKAGSLPPKVVLAGWLYRHAGFVAAALVRSEHRRRRRERTAMELQALQPDTDWSHIAPVLEDAMQELSDRDRMRWCCASSTSSRWPKSARPSA